MKCNVGKVERAIRLVVGVGLIAIVFVGPQTPWGWIGVVPLVTGLSGFCPAWMGLGVNTCSTKEKEVAEQ